MSETDNEAFYDAEVAPVLADLSKRLTDRGMNFIALATYDDIGSVARTVGMVPGAPLMIRAADALARCWAEGGSVNFDQFLMATVNDQDGKPHSSIMLQMLGAKIGRGDCGRTPATDSEDSGHATPTAGASPEQMGERK